MNKTITIRTFQPADEPQVIELWHHCGLTRPQNDPHKDIRRKLSLQPHMFLVAVTDDVIVGTVMAGYEGHRGWINYVATSPHYRRRGIARALMLEAEQLLKAAGCPKINLQVRANNQEALNFYRALGFAIDDVISMGKRLEQD